MITFLHIVMFYLNFLSFFNLKVSDLFCFSESHLAAVVLKKKAVNFMVR